jgi:hypothetical protein
VFLKWNSVKQMVAIRRKRIHILIPTGRVFF